MHDFPMRYIVLCFDRVCCMQRRNDGRLFLQPARNRILLCFSAASILVRLKGWLWPYVHFHFVSLWALCENSDIAIWFWWRIPYVGDFSQFLSDKLNVWHISTLSQKNKILDFGHYFGNRINLFSQFYHRQSPPKTSVTETSTSFRLTVLLHCLISF